MYAPKLCHHEAFFILNLLPFIKLMLSYEKIHLCRPKFHIFFLFLLFSTLPDHASWRILTLKIAINDFAIFDLILPVFLYGTDRATLHRTQVA